MTDQKRHGTSKSGWCIDGHHDGCTYPPCPCDHHKACSGCPFNGCDDCDFQGGKGVVAQANPAEMCENGDGKDERPATGIADRSSHSDSLPRKGGMAK